MLMPVFCSGWIPEPSEPKGDGTLLGAEESAGVNGEADEVGDGVE